MNKKLKLYRIGGKLYYKKGGKLCRYKPLRKYQSGLDIRDSDVEGYDDAANIIGSLNSAEGTGIDVSNMGSSGNNFGKKIGNYFSNTDNLGNVANLAGTALKGLQSNNYNPDNKYTETVSKGIIEGNDTINNIKSGVASAMGPWGGFVTLGTSLAGLSKNKDKYGMANSKAQEVVGNLFSPSERLKESIGVGKKYGFGEGLLNFFSYGKSGYDRRRATLDLANAEQKYDEKRNRMFDRDYTGQMRNDTIYAKEGSLIKPKYNRNNKPNAEIEDGEIVYDPNGNIPSTVLNSKNANTSSNSKYAAKFHGDKHGQDSDKDGQEGIVGSFPEGSYVFSEFLGMNGKKITKRKKGGKNKKSVADTAKPYVDLLAKAEENSSDKSINNPIVKQEALSNLERIMDEAEMGKKEVKLMEMLGWDESRRDQVRSIIESDPNLFQQLDEEVKNDNTVEKQEGGEVDEPIETVVNENIVNLADRIPGLIRSDIDVNTLTGEENDVISEEYKDMLYQKGLTEDDLNMPIKDIMKGNSGKKIYEILNETNNSDNIKKPNKMKRRRKLSRYQKGNTVITPEYMEQLRKKKLALEAYNTKSSTPVSADGVSYGPMKNRVKKQAPVKKPTYYAGPPTLEEYDPNMAKMQKDYTDLLETNRQRKMLGLRPLLTNDPTKGTVKGTRSTGRIDVGTGPNVNPFMYGGKMKYYMEGGVMYPYAGDQMGQLQQGGEMMEPGAESEAAMQQMLQAEGMAPEQGMMEEGMEGQMEGEMDASMANMPPEVQQMIGQLPPEIQQMVMSDPQLMELAQSNPEQFMIAVQSMMNQVPQEAPQMKKGGMMSSWDPNDSSMDFTDKTLDAVMKKFNSKY